MSDLEAAFSDNRERNSSYWITFKNGLTVKGKPYQVQPSDPFFVLWLDCGGFACYDFDQVGQFQRLPETGKIRTLSMPMRESEGRKP